jgi:hypothetical protein
MTTFDLLTIGVVMMTVLVALTVALNLAGCLGGWLYRRFRDRR